MNDTRILLPLHVSHTEIVYETKKLVGKKVHKNQTEQGRINKLTQNHIIHMHCTHTQTTL